MWRSSHTHTHSLSHMYEIIDVRTITTELLFYMLLSSTNLTNSSYYVRIGPVKYSTLLLCGYKGGGHRVGSCCCCGCRFAVVAMAPRITVKTHHLEKHRNVTNGDRRGLTN